MLEGKKVLESSQEKNKPQTTRNNTQNVKEGRTGSVSPGCNNPISPGQRFSLPLEHCTPCPAPGPLTSPLLGGLPGNSPLTAGPAASFRLAQLKAQLALTHMNNVFAVGGQAVTLTANTNTPPSRFPSTPPSPTAVAINLLNLLKIANTMSHPLYNPFISGKPSSSQGQYGLASGQTERDPRKVSSHLGSATSFGSSGMSSLTPGRSGGPIPSLLGLSVNYRPERGRITVDEEIERCLDLNISKAREEVRLQSLNQNAHFTSTQRDQFSSSSTGMTSYLTSSISQPSSASRSLDWLPIYKLDTEDNASKIHSSTSSGFLGSGDGRFNTSGDGNRDVQSIPGLGDYDKPMPDKFVPPQESSFPKYTSESASNILLQFGLEKEDLEHLISYPEDQMTPDNLPFILRQIRVDKEKRTSTSVQSKPYSETQPITTVSGMNKPAPTSSRGTVLNQDEEISIVLKPSKVIDYGHTGKYTAGAGNEMGRAVGSTAKVGGSGTDTYKNISHGREAQPKSTSEFKSGSFVSSRGQMSSVPSFSTPRSSMAPPSSGPTKKLEPQPLLKSLPLKQPEPDSKPACNLFRGVHPGRPGLVLIGSNDSQNSSRNLIQMSKASEQMKNLQGQQQQNLQGQQQQKLQGQQQQMKQQPRQQTQPHQAQPQQQPRIISGMKPRPPPPSNVPVHLARHQPIPNLMSIVPCKLVPPPKERFQAKMVLPKHLPIPSMMQDYAAATPTIFPHTCSLCIKECTTMEAWLVHQNTSLHLENCRLLRTRYPDWDGKAPELKSAPSKDAKPLLSTSAEISLSHRQKSRLLSPSRSHSPPRLHGSVDGRQKRSSRSRSRSPQRHSYGLEERSQKRSSRSPQHHYAHENRRERRSSRSWSPYSSQHSRRSNPRSLTPRNDRPTASRYRSRSRSHERRSSSRGREDRRPSPRRSHERRSSPRSSHERRSSLRSSHERRSSLRSSHERRSSPRSSHERRSSPRSSHERRSSPRRSHERRSSADGSLPQRRRSRSAERLAKRLLETPAVQSLSKKSDLEAMVKTLAPALLAELTKMKSSSSAASSSSTKSTKLKPSLQKSGTSSSSQHKSATVSISAKVRIKVNSGSLSHHDVTTAVEKFGKIKSVVLYRSSKEAVVCFEREEDAEKLRAMTSFNVKKLPVSIIKDESTGPKKTQSTKEKKTPTTKEQKTPATKEQKAAPQQKSAKSSVSTTQTTKSNSSAKVKTPSSSGAKTTTTGNVPKAKVLVSKAKNVLPKQVAKTAKTTNANGKGAAKSEAKKETSVVPKSKSTEKRPEAGDSKPKTTPTKSESTATKSAVAPNETASDKEQSNTTVAEPVQKEEIVTEAKNLASKEETSSTAQKPKMQPEQVAPPEAVKIEKVAETFAKDNSLISKSANQPGAAETKVQESMPVHEDTHLKECLRVDVKTEDVKPVMPEETGATEPMEVESSVKSEDQNLTETKTSPTKPSVSHPVTTAIPCTSPPKPSTEPPQSVKEETLLEMSSQVQPSSSPHSESALEDHKAEAEILEAQEQGEKPTEMKPEDQVTGVEPQCEPAPEPVSNISVGSPEAASSAKTHPDDEAESHQQTATAASCAPDDVTTSTVNKKMEEHQQQEETGCVQTETVVSSTSALPDLSNNEDQTTPEASISVSPIPTTSAKSDAVEEESVSTDIKEVVVDSTLSHETSETMKEEQLPKTPVTSADKPTIPPGFSATVSVTNPVKTEENAVELPHISEDIFKAFTFVLREHKRKKETKKRGRKKKSTTMSKTTSVSVKEDKQSTKSQDEDFSSDIFNESDFSFEDFVTVDEITEDMEDTAVHESSSLSNPTFEEKERQSSNVTPSSKRTTSEASKDCKSSTSASSSSSSTAKSRKTSSTSSSKSVETRISPRQKTQPSKTKTSPKDRSTPSPTTAVETSVQTNRSHKKEYKPTDSTVAETDHKVFAESSAAKTVESVSKTKKSEMDPPAQGEKLEITHQTHSLETELRDETQKEVKTSKEKEMKMNEDGKSTEEDEDYENFQIIDSLDEQTDEQINEKDKDSTKTRVSPRQKAQPSKTKTSPKDRSTPSSTTAVKSSVQSNRSHKKENKLTDSTVAETDHKVSAKSRAAKTVESESKTKTSEMDPPAQGEKLEITHQTHSLETELRDETQKEVKTSKETEMKMNEDGKSTEEDEDYENFQIIDSLDEQTDEQINEKDKDSTETQTLGLEKDQILHQGCHQVSETADNDGKANPDASSEMEMDQSILVQDGANKIKTVTADDEDKGSIVMQESEDAAQVAHNSEESLGGGTAHKNQVLDQDTNQTPRSEGEAKEKEVEILSEEICRTSKEADQVSDEHKPLENIDSKDIEQEASVNSADDQTTTKGKKIEAPNQETSQTDIGTTEEDEDVYQIIDSLEDQPTTETAPETNEDKQTKKGSATTSRDERSTRSSRSKSRASKVEDKGKSPKKQDITGIKHETSVKDSKTKKDEKIDESSEEMVFEVVDSIEYDPVQEASTTRRSGRRQSARRHKEDEKTLNLQEGPDKSSKKEETYKVLDSVGEETSSEKPSTRSTRGRKEKNEISNENEKTKKDKTPTRRRHTPSRDSHEKDKEKTSKTSVNDPLKGSTPTKSDTAVRDTSEEEVTYEILDAVEEEEADEKPTTQKPRRGRPKKDVKPTKKETKASKGVDLPQKVAEEEEGATYQILDAVEGEIDDQATKDQTENTRKSTPSAKDESSTKKRTRSSKKKEEEEPLYQVVDSLEDDQVELIRDVSGVQDEKSDTKDKKADSVPSGSSAVEAFKKAEVEDKDQLQGVKDVPSAEGSKTEGSKSDVKKQEESLTKSKLDATKSEKAMQKSPKKTDTTASEDALVSLDEVSDEELDYPDDTVEKAEIKTSQAASEGRENKQKEKRTREKDTRESKSRSRSRSRGGSVEMEKKTKEMSQEKEESVEAENQELVTLDEVGEDEAEEAGVRESPKCDRMLMEGELQELVTLDEINEEDGKEKPGTLEAPSLSQENQSGDSLKPEILSALNEAAHDQDKKADTEDTKEPSSSVKRRLDDNTEESEDFLTVDEVGTTEEKDKKPATRGQPKKRSRQTPVKQLTEGTMDSNKHKEDKKESLPPASVDLSSTPDKHSTALSGDAKLEIQKTEMKTETVSAEQQLKSESPDEKKLDGCEQEKEEKKEKRSRVEVTPVDKLSEELKEPAAKRPCSESPSLPVDFKLPPFNPKSPLGQEFVVPKSGFFCNLCSMFYFKENVAKGTHCSSQKHYDNLLKHYQKLQQKTSSSSPQNSKGSVTDGSN